MTLCGNILSKPTHCGNNNSMKMHLQESFNDLIKDADRFDVEENRQANQMI